MKPTRPSPGFSLIEIIVVLVVVGIAGAALLTMYGQAAKTLGTNEDVQTAAQLAQECSEHILEGRRRNTQPLLAVGNNNSICNGFTGAWGALGYGAPDVDVFNVAPAPGGLCPTGATCRQAVISVNQGAAVRAQVTLLLMI